MLQFELEAGRKFSRQGLAAMPLIDVMDDDRHFTIRVDRKVFFDDPYFPIREFTLCALRWLDRPQGRFEYRTIDSEQNPLLAFLPRKKGFKMYSVWQKFPCKEIFSRQQIQTLLREITAQVVLPDPPSLE